MKHIHTFEGFINDLKKEEVIREEIGEVLKEGNFKTFADLEFAIKAHERGDAYYDEIKLKSIFNQLKNSDQIKARKKYSDYFGK